MLNTPLWTLQVLVHGSMHCSKEKKFILHVMLPIIKIDLTTSHEKGHIIIDSLASFDYTQHCQFCFS
jgi:hypothetical protein